jgi:hypothetical protein
VTGNSATTGPTVTRGSSEMTEDTLLLARLRATAKESALRCPSSARVSLLRLAAEDVGRLRRLSVRDWLARLQEADTMTSRLLATVAHRAAADSLLVENVRQWPVV